LAHQTRFSRNGRDFLVKPLGRPHALLCHVVRPTCGPGQASCPRTGEDGDHTDLTDLKGSLLRGDSALLNEPPWCVEPPLGMLTRSIPSGPQHLVVPARGSRSPRRSRSDPPVIPTDRCYPFLFLEPSELWNCPRCDCRTEQPASGRVAHVLFRAASHKQSGLVVVENWSGVVFRVLRASA
jgi:hypothetical protein